MISRRDGQITLTDDFNNLALIPSNPVALFGSNEFIIDNKL